MSNIMNTVSGINIKLCRDPLFASSAKPPFLEISLCSCSSLAPPNVSRLSSCPLWTMSLNLTKCKGDTLVFVNT